MRGVTPGALRCVALRAGLGHWPRSRLARTATASDALIRFKLFVRHLAIAQRSECWRQRPLGSAVLFGPRINPPRRWWWINPSYPHPHLIMHSHTQ